MADKEGTQSTDGANFDYTGFINNNRPYRDNNDE